MKIVSACLAGYPCRWDGKVKAHPLIIEMVKRGEAVPVCPEQLGGLTTPREPSEIKNGCVHNKAGKDVSVEFKRGAEIVLSLAKLYNCQEAVMKAKSPSCGSCEIYDGNFRGVLTEGDGITTTLLKQNGIKVITEEDL